MKNSSDKSNLEMNNFIEEDCRFYFSNENPITYLFLCSRINKHFLCEKINFLWACTKRYGGFIVMALALALLIIAFIFNSISLDNDCINFLGDNWIKILGFSGLIITLLLNTFKEEIKSPTLRVSLDKDSTKKGTYAPYDYYYKKLESKDTSKNESDSVKLKASALYYGLKLENLNPNTVAENVQILLTRVRLVKNKDNEPTDQPEYDLPTVVSCKGERSVNVTYDFSFPLCQLEPTSRKKKPELKKYNIFRMGTILVHYGLNSVPIKQLRPYLYKST